MRAEILTRRLLTSATSAFDSRILLVVPRSNLDSMQAASCSNEPKERVSLCRLESYIETDLDMVSSLSFRFGSRWFLFP